MKEKLNQIKKQFDADIQNCKTLKEVEDVKVKYLGKTGLFADIM